MRPLVRSLAVVAVTAVITTGAVHAARSSTSPDTETSPAPHDAAAVEDPAAPVPTDWDYSTVIGYSGADTEMHLTFDDGPGSATPQVLDVLDHYGVTATFCMTGQQVDKEPDLAREVSARGHQLCNHSYSHNSAINRGSAQQITDEIELANDAFSRQLEVGRPGFYRAPEGVFHGQVPAALADLQMRALGWSVDSRDWTRPGVDTIVGNVLSQVGPGKIVLMHDAGGADRAQTVAALPRIIEGIRQAGFTLTPVS